MTWHVGRLWWDRATVYTPAACRARGCQLYQRWQDDGPRVLIQHNGDPREPPTEQVLALDRHLPDYSKITRVRAWVEQVHAYEAEHVSQ